MTLAKVKLMQYLGDLAHMIKLKETARKHIEHGGSHKDLMWPALILIKNGIALPVDVSAEYGFTRLLKYTRRLYNVRHYDEIRTEKPKFNSRPHSAEIHEFCEKYSFTECLKNDYALVQIGDKWVDVSPFGDDIEL